MYKTTYELIKLELRLRTYNLVKISFKIIWITNSKPFNSFGNKMVIKG